MGRMASLLLTIIFAMPPIATGAEPSTDGGGDGSPTVDQPPIADAELELEGAPPSPSTAPGERIWPEPRLTHWPPVVYRDEHRNCAFRLPVRDPGQPGSVGWEGGARLAFTLPEEERIDSASGLVDLPGTPGEHRLVLRLGEAKWTLPFRLVPVGDTWPHQNLINGFPVDGAGFPVGLLARRRDADVERRYALFKPELPRGTGEPVIVGDPMPALGSTSWDGLELRQVPVAETRHPHHAALVTIAGLGDAVPATLVWSPGNHALLNRTWSSEEERFLDVVEARYQHRGRMPRLLLVLPPVPVDEALHEEAGRRRGLLARMADRLGWEVIDAERVCGPAAEANRVGEGVYTTYPHGEARIRLRDAIAQAVAEE